MRPALCVSRKLLTPESGNQQNLLRIYGAGDVVDERQRSRIRPMNIINEQDYWASGGYRCKGFCNSNKRLVFPYRRRECLRLSKLQGLVWAFQPLRYFRGAWGFSVLFSGEIGIKRLKKREVGNRGIAEAPSGQDCCAVFFYSVQEFGGEPCFSATCLA